MVSLRLAVQALALFALWRWHRHAQIPAISSRHPVFSAPGSGGEPLHLNIADLDDIYGAMGTLLGRSGNYGSYGSSFVYYTVVPIDTSAASALRFVTTIAGNLTT